MSKTLLTRAQCEALRGIAIIGIFMHNYCHWLGPIVKENEYTFSIHNVQGLLQVLSHPDINLPVHLISFFGHYGVPLFLFLSAYGLVIKYEHTVERKVAVAPFISYHYLKLFKMMIVGFVAFVLVDSLMPPRWHYDVVSVVAQLLMVNNVLPNPDHVIWPGPYWFFGLMLQLYIVYRLLLYRRHWGWTAGLMALCLVLQLLIQAGAGPESETLNRYRYNFMGGMLPFGMGLLYARYGAAWQMPERHQLQGQLLVFLMSLALIFAGSLTPVLWTLVPIFICTAGVSLIQLLYRLRGRFATWLCGALEWMGAISAALFVCHPITRKVIIPISRSGDIYTGLLLYVVASVCVAWLFKLLLQHIPNPKLR